jgi:hypothetical protein
MEKYLVPYPNPHVGYIFDSDVWYSLTGMWLHRGSYDEKTWRILSCALTKINKMRDPYPVIVQEGSKMEYNYVEFGITGVAVILSVPSDEVPNLNQKVIQEHPDIYRQCVCMLYPDECKKEGGKA